MAQKQRKHPSPLARFFPPFAAGRKSPGSKERMQKQAARRFRRETPKLRAGFTKPALTEDDRLIVERRRFFRLYAGQER